MRDIVSIRDGFWRVDEGHEARESRSMLSKDFGFQDAGVRFRGGCSPYSCSSGSISLDDVPFRRDFWWYCSSCERCNVVVGEVSDVVVISRFLISKHEGRH